MTPQAETVLRHLQTNLAKGLSGVEAAAVYKIRHLPRRIADLKEAGHAIKTVTKRDPTGQRYARYFLEGAQSHG